MISQEQNREYWDRQPCNVKHSPKLVGTREWSLEVTARKYLVEPHIPRFAQFPRWSGKRVLEIGCGIGTDTLEFMRANVLHIDAMDLSSESLSLAWNRAMLAGCRCGSFHCGDAETWQPSVAVDLVYSFGVLHHTPHPEEVLRKAHSRLKANGELRIMLYAKWSVKNLLRQQPEAQAGCPLARTFSKRQVRKLLKSTGFTAVSIKKDHIFPYQIEPYRRHEYQKHWIYQVMPPGIFSWLERRLGWHLLIVAKKAA